MNVFDFVNSINFNKTDLFQDPQADKDYIPFVVNRSLSYFHDTVLLSNEMNIRHDLSKQQQFDFLRLSVTKKKRFSKWGKKEEWSDQHTAIQQYYKCSVKKVMEICLILSTTQKKYIYNIMSEGGVAKK
jgi:hypothetical protein